MTSGSIAPACTFAGYSPDYRSLRTKSKAASLPPAVSRTCSNKPGLYSQSQRPGARHPHDTPPLLT